jgi:uncharacterized beta-barrel protein YwiB (DUF1934 family)
MRKDVYIKIKGLQLGSEEDPIESKLQGTYSLINGSHYISYEEKLSENQLTTKNIIKISPSQVSITKKDFINTQMVFDTKEITNTDYHTQYGSIKLEVRTKSIIIVDKPDLLELKMEYSLLSGESLISDNQIIIEIIPV